jgi:hypothetical protein
LFHSPIKHNSFIDSLSHLTTSKLTKQNIARRRTTTTTIIINNIHSQRFKLSVKVVLTQRTRTQETRMQGELELPPGFRFHPTDEELVNHYLCRKCAGQSISVPVVKEVDLYKFDPWQLPGT